ncbi:MAG: carbon-nitrogen hydrolase family protein [Candidatus Dadabacteria bacterium]|nr:carbon-nitrogen hydrolase family protein [Candidatus Dadabacteria bacterium]NIS08684.1 carbon-nitrogen hydrolase family protein [Candidatus Dadabacteria bacterium]NIY23031.1 carbon-nitrogen hydrolase family protein [Candidatus Dadabacteria bacterium]
MGKKVLGGREKVKVAVVQASPVFMDKARSIKKACKLIKQAGRNGAELIVFSEAFIPGYPAYYSVGYETPPYEWTDFMIALHDNSLLIPGEDTETLGKAAKSAGAYVVIGCNEIDDRAGSCTVYNSLLYMDKYGEVMGRHRKLMPTYTERVYWGMGDGSDLNVYDTEIGRIGGLVCWENHMPLARVAMINQGEEFHVCVWPGNWKRGSEQLLDADTSEGGGGCNLQNLIKVHAFEAGAFVLSACGFQDKEDFPKRWEYIRDSDHMNFCWAQGGSSIVNPAGRYLAEPNFEKDAILYTDCYANQIKATKAIFDSLGHYSRWDVLQLQVNRKNRLDPEVYGNSKAPAELSRDEIKRISEDYEIEIEKVERLVDEIQNT